MSRPRRRTSPIRRWLAATTSVLIGPALLLALPPMPAHADDITQIVDELTDSAVTVGGEPADPAAGRFGDFSDLEITVSQTRNLTDQAVLVSWTGAVPTPRERSLGLDYLTIMQCWGEDPDAPGFRETCQYGGGVGKYNLGRPGGASANGANRTPGIVGSSVPDPAETLPDDAQIVPFQAVDGTRTAHGGADDPFPSDPLGQPLNANQVLADFFNVFTTNEVTGVHSSGEGTGRVVFEVQSAVRAPDLGCGLQVESCWLVVVPYGHHHQITGADLTGTGSAVNGSPLTASNWQYRIPIRLDFQPVAGFCRLGQEERRTVGTELVAHAVTSWQPVLCADDGPVFGYSELGDFTAAQQLLSPLSGAPGLAFTADPVLPGAGQPAVVHAPVALSGAVIATNIDVNLPDPDGPFAPPPEVEPLRATQVRDLRLTPRLVAKLLTQSYLSDVPGANQGVNGNDPAQQEKYADLTDNPVDLRRDPEFLELNPVFALFPTSSTTSSPDPVIVTIGDRAAAREVWRWILADPAARDWLGGEPDEHGMTVNPRYAFVDDGVPPSNFPKADDRCHEQAAGVAASCQSTLGLAPYMNTMQEAAYQTLRADEKEQIWDPNRVPPSFGAVSPTSPGERFTVSITDAASAARFGLFVAALRNRAGEFLTPTPDSLLAGVDTMVPSEEDPDVLAIDPEAEEPGAYPLSMLTYAAADLTEPDAARADYADLIRYAVGDGQTPGVDLGELPPGYAPLPGELRDQARDAADVLAEGLPDPPPSGSPTPGSGGPGGGPGGGGNGGGGDGGAPDPDGVPDPGADPVVAPTATAPVVPVAQLQETPGDPLGWLRFVLIAVAVVGALGLCAGPVLLLLGRDRGAEATTKEPLPGQYGPSASQLLTGRKRSDRLARTNPSEAIGGNP